jgi:hypothetical protein
MDPIACFGAEEINAVFRTGMIKVTYIISE